MSPPSRSGKEVPDSREIPPAYGDLIEWYRREYVGSRESGGNDPILSLRGLGREIWADEDADEYVARLREGWQ